MIPVMDVTATEPVMWVGDTHGNILHWRELITFGAQHEVKWFFQVGDFGYWENFDNPVHYAQFGKKPLGTFDSRLTYALRYTDWDGKIFLDLLQILVEEIGAIIVFIDGNHEAHPYLREWYPTPNGFGFHEVRPNIWYWPRAHRAMIGGYQALGLGGAHSIDGADRRDEMAKRNKKIDVYGSTSKKRFEDWFPEELITEAELDAAITGGHADLVLTHDAPASADIQMQFFIKGGGRDFLEQDPASVDQRGKLEILLWETTPTRWLHGHYHLRYNYRIPSTNCFITGLDRDNMGNLNFILASMDELMQGR